MKPSRIRLKSYTGDSVSVLGEAEVQVQFDPQEKPRQLNLLVVQKGVALLGRDWLEQCPALIQKCANPESIANHSSPTPSVHSVQDDLQTILTKHNQVFDHSSIGTLKGYKAKVHPQEETDDRSLRIYFC